MNEISQQWRDEGSGPGHMQTVVVPELSPLEQAYRAMLDHTSPRKDSPGCAECRTEGTDCETAAGLRKAWRAARNAEAAA